MPSIDLDDEFLELFYNITNSKPPKELELLDLKKQLINIVDTLKELNSNAKKPIYSRAINPDIPDDDSEKQGPAILIVDDLGVITYQLKVLLSQFDYDIDCSQEIYDAVNKFKKRKYQYVVMDLFIPTEREGFILLAELKKWLLQPVLTLLLELLPPLREKKLKLSARLVAQTSSLKKQRLAKCSIWNYEKLY